MSEVTQILSAIEQGDPHAPEQLLPLVYEAYASWLHRGCQESPGQTLQATALVHEVYLRLVGSEKGQHWDSRGHFFAAAAEAMKRLLIDNARRKRREKHGGDRKRIDLDQACSLTEDLTDEVIAVDEAIDRLASEDSQKAELVKLRYFAGFSLEEAAELMGISRAMAKRHWAYARAWLYVALGDADTKK